MPKLFDPKRRDHAIALGHVSPGAGALAGGLFGGKGRPGNLGPTGTRVPDWQRGVQGAGVNPAAAQNPTAARPSAPAVRPTAGLNGLGAVAAQAFQNRAPRPTAARPTAAPAGIAPYGGFGMGGIRVYSNGGKVYNRKPNGKKC